MAAKGTFPIKVDSSLRSFALVLKTAACEWLLLFLLLLDAAFSYFLTKFAQYCGLQLPCPLCSRLDHVLGNAKPNFYTNLLCSDHRSELSSLVLCHNHGKLADVHEMCEECLLSFAKNESNQEIYKILVGKLGSDCLQKPFLSMDSVSGSLSTRLCSCCAKPWRSRPNVHKLVQSRPPGPDSKPDIPLPKSPARRCLNRQEGLKKRKDRFSVSTTPIVLGSTDYDTLSHVGYTEVKITSDSESDFPFSDDEDAITVPRGRKNAKGDYPSQQGSNLLAKKQCDDFSPGEVIHKSTHTPSNLMPVDPEPEEGEITTPKFYASDGDVRHRETNWQQIRKKASPIVPELTSLEDIPLSTSAPEMSPVLSADEGDRVSLSRKFGASGFSDLVFHNNASSSKSMQLPVRLSKENWVDTKENGDIGHTSTMNHWESIDLNSTTTFKGNVSDPVRSDHNGVGSNEEPTTSKTSLVHADVSIESPMPSKSPSMERSRSLESLEGSLSEIEGENLVDKLRKQVENDKKRINNLYKELEEERSASATAANEAMAMITKLQEEKAALHMEALQYLRMLEEQAEYDVEELERANNLLAEKEKEIQDLEAELDYFRIKYPEEFPEDSEMHGECLDVEDALNSNVENIVLEES